MDVGQLHRVPDRLDLVLQSPHVGVGDVGNLLEHQLLDLGADQLLEGQTVAGVDPDVVAGPEVHTLERPRQLDDPFLVGLGRHQQAVVRHHLLDRDHLAQAVELPGLDDVHRVVDEHLLAPLELLYLDGGLGVDPHLPPATHHVHGAVAVHTQYGGERIGRRGELLHLLAQHGQLLPGFSQDGAEFLVLLGGLHQPALGLGQPGLQHPHPPRRVLEASAQYGHLLLQREDRRTHGAQLAFVLVPFPAIGHHTIRLATIGSIRVSPPLVSGVSPLPGPSPHAGATQRPTVTKPV